MAVVDFEGFVLRKPRIASSNSPFTAEADTFVRDQDRSTYDTEFLSNSSAVSTEYLVQAAFSSDLVVPAEITESATFVSEWVYSFNPDGREIASLISTTGSPTEVDLDSGLIRYGSDPGGPVSITYEPARLAINWAKNDTRTRFGFQEVFQRWAPLPGAPPENLGSIPEDGLLTLPVVEEVEPLLVIGTPDQTSGTVVPVPSSNRVDAPTFDDYVSGVLTVPAGQAVLNEDSGDLLLADDLISGFLNIEVFFFRSNFFAFDESTGQIGLVGDALYMNPIPTTDELPRIRIGYRTFLEAEESTTSTTPSTGFDLVWNSNTGQVFLDASLLSEFDGEPVYFDGVLNSLQPVSSHPHTDLGTIDNTNPFNTSLPNVDLSTYAEDSIILYVKETGQALRSVEFVDDSDDLEQSLFLRGDRAQIVRGTGELQLGFSFRSANDGNTLTVGTNAFPIEGGISFRWQRSPVDPTNERGLPDARSKVRLSNEVLANSLPQGPTFLLNQIPLQDIAGFDTNVFFQVQKGAKKRLLQPDVDVIYDFDNQQLRWLEQASHFATITEETFGLNLPDSVLHDVGFLFELNEGSGFEELEEGEDTLIDFGAGVIQFVERLGSILFEDVGTLTAPDTLEATTADFSSLTIPSDPLLAPLLVAAGEAYRVQSATTDTVTVDRDFTFSGSSTTFEILEVPEIVFRYMLQAIDLRERTVFPYVETDLDEGGQNFAPEGEELEFISDGTVVSHVVLEPEVIGQLDGTATLPLPSYYQASTSNFRLVRETLELTEVGGTPGPDEFTISGTDIVFNASDAASFEGTDILLLPELSTGRATGPVEVLSETREIGLPDDLTSTEVLVRVLVPESEVTQQANVLFFDKPFRSGQRLFVRYLTDADTTVEEAVGFRVLEDVTPSGSQTIVSYATGIDVDDQRPVTVLVNGHPSSLEPTGNKTVDVSSVRTGRKVQVSYFALGAQGGEQVVQLLNAPFAPPVEFSLGANQEFRGDHTSELTPGTYLQADEQSFEIVSSNYDSGSNTTSVEISPPAIEGLLDPETFHSSSPVTDRSGFTATAEANSQTATLLRLFGDHTDVLKQEHVLYVDGDPYRIASIVFREASGQTDVTLESGLMQEYSNPSLEVSDYPVYAPNPERLRTQRIALTDADVRLYRFLPSGEGQVLEAGSDFRFEAGGEIVLNSAVTDPPEAGEVWYLEHTALRKVGPKRIGGQTFLPRFRASYSKQVNASNENGFLGAVLRGSFDFPSPDSFYFRAVRTGEYAGEVAQLLEQQASQNAPSGGALVSVGQDSSLSSKGNTGLIYEAGDLRDQDRAGRDFLDFYNRIITLFENLLEIVDGRVVGNIDGKFLFELRDDNTPGGIDPVTGELLPYYANPLNPGTKPTSAELDLLELEDQSGTIKNFIDDIIFVSKKPFELDFGLPLTFRFLGTFEKVWEPSRLSRIYPEQKRIFTITTPSRSGDPEYKFLADFGRILADAKETSILSATNIRKRASKARVRLNGATSAQDGNGGEVRIRVGMEFDRDTGDITNVNFDPTTGIPGLFIPPFEVDDHVNLGRITFSESGGVVTKTISTYGENLIVTSVGGDYIEVKTNPNAGSHPDLTATDATTLDPLIGDTIFTIAPVMVDTGAFALDAGDTPPYYRTPIDLFVNASDGELVNASLPEFLSNIIGQADIEPLTFLDVTLNIRNQLTAPFRFPALDGEPLDDDGDQKPPFVEPFQDSELQRLNAEIVANQNVQDETEAGLVISGDIVTTNRIDVGFDLSTVTNPPEEFDLVVVEDETDISGDSTIYSVARTTATDLVLAAFVWTDGTVSYDLESVIDDIGERDSGNTSRWNDPDVDFTDFSGSTSQTLNVNDGAGGYSQYTITGLNNGFVTTAVAIVEAGPTDYFISVTGSGSISFLERLETPGVDCTFASGDLVITDSGPNNGTYTADGGGIGFVYPQLITQAPSTTVNVGISNTSDVASGTGTVVLPDTLETTDSVAGIEVGQQLTIDSADINGGRYTVASVATGAPNTITITGSFFANSGPGVGWEVDSKRRRFSDELITLRDELIRQRVTYALNSDADPDIAPLLTATSNNPSTPHKERLTELLDLLFETVVSVSGGEVVAADTAFEGADFQAADVQEGDFVLVETGPNRGFYPIVTVDVGASPQQLVVNETNEFETFTLSDEVGLDYEVVRGSLFQPKTYELVLYEYTNVLGIIERIDQGIRVTQQNPGDLVGSGTLGSRPGDPDDTTLDAHIAEVNDRFAWIRDASPNLRDEINAVLKGREALYDIRYSWIDFRTNLETGTLPRRDRFDANRAKEERKILRDLLKLLSTGAS